MLTGSNLQHAKQFNLRIVHETVRLHGPLSRADVARLTALTGQTVSNLVRELIELGLVVEAHPRADRRLGRRAERRGAPAADLAINPDGAFAIGLDFNRDHLTGIVVDLAGVVRQREDVDIEFPTPDQALDLLAEMAERLLGRHGLPRERVCGVGIGIPGPMHPAADGHGYVVTPSAFPGWHDVPLAGRLQERLGLPVLLENNATAAAVGERWYGAGRHLESFFYVFLGSGLGGGLVLNGRPYEGATGNAGEIGFLPAEMAGGAGGDVGGHFNLPRLYEQLRAAGERGQTPSDLGPLFDAGHPALLAWVETAAAHLTGLVLAVEYLVDPEAVIFGGRLPERMLHAFCERVAAALPARRVSGKLAAPRLLLATAGSAAAALGVATLPIHELFAPAPQVLLKQSKRAQPAGLTSPRLAASA